MALAQPIFRRVFLKLSGEVLQGNQGFGFDPSTLERLAAELSRVRALGVELACVVGGGNFIRGAHIAQASRPTADSMGMLATVINGLALCEALRAQGCGARLFSAYTMPQVCDVYHHATAKQALEAGEVAVLTAGLGQPYFTTDTAATVRALELGCDVMMKGTKFPGVFDKDPSVFPTAQRFDRLSYDDVVTRKLRVMDATAITLAEENSLPLVVFSIRDAGAFESVIVGAGLSTLIAQA